MLPVPEGRCPCISGCLLSGAATAFAAGRLPASSFASPSPCTFGELLSARHLWGHCCQGCRQLTVAGSAVPGPAGKGCAHRTGETHFEQWEQR